MNPEINVTITHVILKHIFLFRIKVTQCNPPVTGCIISFHHIFLLPLPSAKFTDNIRIIIASPLSGKIMKNQCNRIIRIIIDPLQRS